MFRVVDGRRKAESGRWKVDGGRRKAARQPDGPKLAERWMRRESRYITIPNGLCPSYNIRNITGLTKRNSIPITVIRGGSILKKMCWTDGTQVTESAEKAEAVGGERRLGRLGRLRWS